MAYYNSSDDGYSSNDDEHEKEDTRLELALEKLNIGPKKNKLVVLNLNGLLVHRAHKHDQSSVPKRRSPDGVYRCNRLIYKRDFLDEFMKFCFDRFEVGLWSSAQEHNVDDVLDCAFKGFKRPDQAQCTDSGFKSLENSRKPVFCKDLSKVWSHLASTSQGVRFSASNTLLIDDDPCKGLINPPNTGIFPASYDPNDANDNALDPEQELGHYLEGLAKAEDVPSYVKEHSFGQPAIGPNHPRWDFYSRIVRRLKNN